MKIKNELREGWVISLMGANPYISYLWDIGTGMFEGFQEWQIDSLGNRVKEVGIG